MYRVPSLALNEVFIGESLSARVSYYQMSINNGPFLSRKAQELLFALVKININILFSHSGFIAIII